MPTDPPLDSTGPGPEAGAAPSEPGPRFGSWEKWPSGYSYEKNPDGSYTGNYGARAEGPDHHAHDATHVETPAPDAHSWVSAFDAFLPSGDAVVASAPITAADPIIGTPDQDGAAWPGEQTLPDDCAIRCQEFIIDQFTGHDPGETTLVQEAELNGWYGPGQGTSAQDVGNLLELHGIAVNRYQDANIFNLAAELAQGHKVIVGVDSTELWEDHPGPGADHAVVVSGIDTRDPAHPMVVVSDPGTGDAEKVYPLEQFLTAWQDSQFFMVATQDPAPANLPEMAHFDYAAGHIPLLAGMPYEQFLQLEDRPELARDILEAHAADIAPAQAEHGTDLLHDLLGAYDHFGLASAADLHDHNLLGLGDEDGHAADHAYAPEETHPGHAGPEPMLPDDVHHAGF